MADLDERTRPRPSTIGWVVAAAIAAAVGWTAGAQALSPVVVPAPTVTARTETTLPVVPEQTVPADWKADPATPLPAGIPEGRTEVSRLVLGSYVGIPANAQQLCTWRREGPPDSQGAPAVNEQGSSSGAVRMTLRSVDRWFVSTGCQWKLLTPPS